MPTPNEALSNQAFIEHFSEGLLIDFKRFDFKNADKLEPLLTHIGGKAVMLEFRKHRSITKEDLCWSFVDLEVARTLIKMHLFHIQENIVIRFESTDIIRVCLYVRS